LWPQFDEVKLDPFRLVAPEILSPFEDYFLVLSFIDSVELSSYRESGRKIFVVHSSIE
ncbi:hypothetical protein KI387_044622, partial [Taxus chinensis]